MTETGHAVTRTAPRISDVAALAGVSVGTVSKALNGRGQLREQTRERVRAAAEQLGFEPNAVARSLLAGPDLHRRPDHDRPLRALQHPAHARRRGRAGRRRDVRASCATSRDDPIREQHYVRTLLSRRVDGIIVTGRRTRPAAAARPSTSRSRWSTPTRPSDRRGRLLGGHRRGRGRRAAVEHLLRDRSPPDRARHRPSPATTRPSCARRASRRRSRRHGVEPAGGRVWFGEWSEIWGRQAAQSLVAADRDIDAVFCGSDQIARGVADGLRECGLSLPEDVALVGFDNWEALAENCRPPLTTIDLKLEAVGRTAGELLLAAIDGRPTAGTHVIAPKLVVRESSGPPARP